MSGKGASGTGKGSSAAGGGGGGKTEMTKDASARIQSAEARHSGGPVEKGGFASRAQVHYLEMLYV